jgi:PAS domain S-box-containing protein
MTAKGDEDAGGEAAPVPGEELARWRYALENAEDGLWDCRGDLDRVFRSPRCLSMLGLQPGGVHDTTEAWRGLVHPDDRERQRLAIAAHVAGDTDSYRVEYRLRHADGSWRWVLDRGRVITRDAGGRPTRVVGTHTDITQYKALELRLRERELLLAEAQRLANIGSFAWDPATDALWWSDELFRIAGLPREGGPPPWAEQAKLYSPDTFPALRAAVETALADVAGFRLPVDMLRPDGERRHVEVSAGALPGPDGRASRFVGVLRDVTDERRADEAAQWRNKLLSRIAAMGRIGGFDLDVRSGQFQWTDENYRIHGIEPGTPVSVESLMPHYDAVSQAKLRDSLARLASGESEEESAEVEFMNSAERRIVLRLTATLERHDGVP